MVQCGSATGNTYHLVHSFKLDSSKGKQSQQLQAVWMASVILTSHPHIRVIDWPVDETRVATATALQVRSDQNKC